MVVSIGTDIVAVARIEAVLQRHPEAFPRRILHEDELTRFLALGRSVPYLARRFAAKEAISKALRCGIGTVGWRDLRISNDPAGAPVATLLGNALARLEELGGRHIHVTLSDEREYVVAFAVIDGDPRTDAAAAALR